MSDQVKTTPEEAEQRVPVHYDTRLPKLTFLQRTLIPIIGWVVWFVIRMLGPTIRFEVLGGQKAGRDYRPDLPPNIFAFWHRCIIPSAWYFRNRNGVLMNTTNFDGQWTRRVIERLGFGTAQGSSTRGGLRGLAVMAKRLEEGVDAGFTIDGPRGPRYVAKPGPVMLARRSGRPIVLFHIGIGARLDAEEGLGPDADSQAFYARGSDFRAGYFCCHGCRSRRDRKKASGNAENAGTLRDVAESWFSLSEAERDRKRVLECAVSSAGFSLWKLVACKSNTPQAKAYTS